MVQSGSRSEVVSNHLTGGFCHLIAGRFRHGLTDLPAVTLFLIAMAHFKLS